jgi:hypothetical protein
VGVGVGSSLADAAVWLAALGFVTEVIMLGGAGMGREPVGWSVSIARTVLLVARSSSTEDRGGPSRLSSDLSSRVVWPVSIKIFFKTLVEEAEVVVVAGG